MNKNELDLYKQKLIKYKKALDNYKKSLDVREKALNELGFIYEEKIRKDKNKLWGIL